MREQHEIEITPDEWEWAIEWAVRRAKLLSNGFDSQLWLDHWNGLQEWLDSSTNIGPISNKLGLSGYTVYALSAADHLYKVEVTKDIDKLLVRFHKKIGEPVDLLLIRPEVLS